MCAPLAIAGVAAAAQVGSALASHSAQAAAAAANQKSATQAMLESWKDIDIREEQEQDQAAQTIMGADKQARNRQALAAVSAGESGVAGTSVDALLSTFSNDASAVRVNTERNLDATLDQYQAEKRGSQAQAQSRIDAVRPPSDFLTALQIGKAGLDLAGAYNRTKP